MDAELSEEQLLLQQTAREFLARECPSAFVREMMDDPRGTTPVFWRRLVELGWTGLVVPEAHGGAGLGWLELAVLLEEMGAALVPGPFLSSVALGGAALAHAGDEAQRARFLPGVADGSLCATLAFLEPDGGWGPEQLGLVARRDGADWRLSGVKCFVPDAGAADLLVVAARLEHGDGPPGLLAVDASRPGVSRRPVAWTDDTRKVAEVRLDDVRVPAEALLGDGAGGAAALETILDLGRVALCAEMAGIARRVLDLSVAYAKTREQFGRPIGSFQAIQHRCADMLLWTENLRSAAWAAAWSAAGQEPDAHLTACLAKAYASEACARVASAGIQIHGGLGYTWEQDLHLYYKRAKADELALGDASFCRERAARVLLDAG